jgi:HAD superfamily hydrolase (TIGR01509 family)
VGDLLNTVLFDWDGTLIDTAQAAYDAFRKSFGDLGIAIDRDLYHRVFTPNWYNMYRALGLPEDRWPEAEELWLRHYGETIPQLLPGARQALDQLARGGFSLGIVTSGNQIRVMREINGLDLASLFQIVVCCEDVVNKKPHPEGLEIAMDRMKKRREECCYAGDCPEDVEMGKRAGMLTVGIRSGYPNSRKITEAKPDLCYDSVVQLSGELLLRQKSF